MNGILIAAYAMMALVFGVPWAIGIIQVITWIVRGATQ